MIACARRLLVSPHLPAALIASGLAGTAMAQPAAIDQSTRIEMKVSHYLPPNHTVQKVLEDWAQELDTRSSAAGSSCGSTLPDSLDQCSGSLTSRVTARRTWPWA